MKRLGYVTVPATRDTVTSPSSSGWRRTSSTSLRNSGSSSRNSTPLCARLISPGRGEVPPPESPAADTVWCGARNGRMETIGCSRLVSPATEYISVDCIISPRLISGSIPGRRFAIMDLPAPGGPTIRILCPPAAAISSARLTFSCPLTSEKSGICSISVSSAGAAAGSILTSPRIRRSSSSTFFTGYTLIPSANAASAALSAGTNSFFTPQRAAAMAIGSAPYTGRSSPLRDSSPMNAQSSPGSSISPSAARMPMNIGRSYSVPAFFLSAGARFTVMRLTGKR